MRSRPSFEASAGKARGVTEQDIWRAAQLLVDRLGADARALAARRAHELRETGDTAGHDLWMDIIRALDRLLPAAEGAPD